MNNNRRKLYFVSIAVLLLVTAVAKLFSATGSSKILEMSDPIFLVSYGHLMYGVAIMEMLVAAYSYLGRSDLLRALVILWMSTNFMLYRFGMQMLNIRLCPCVGTLGDRIGLTTSQTQGILTALVVYMIIGSATIIYRICAEQERERLGRIAQSPTASWAEQE